MHLFSTSFLVKFGDLSDRNEIVSYFLNKVISTRFAVLLPPRVKNNTTDYTDSHRLRVKIFFNLCISELSVVNPMTGIPLDWTHCQIRNATFNGSHYLIYSSTPIFNK